MDSNEITKADIEAIKRVGDIWNKIMWCKNMDEVLWLLPDNLHQELLEFNYALEKLEEVYCK